MPRRPIHWTPRCEESFQEDARVQTMSVDKTKQRNLLCGPRVALKDIDEASLRWIGRELERRQEIEVDGQIRHVQPGVDPNHICSQSQRLFEAACKTLYHTNFPRDQYLSCAAGLLAKHPESNRNVALAIRHAVDDRSNKANRQSTKRWATRKKGYSSARSTDYLFSQ